MGIQIETKPLQLWLKPVEMQHWQVAGEQTLPSELVGGAARFKTYVTEKALSGQKYLEGRSSLIAEYEHPKKLDTVSSINLDNYSAILLYDEHDIQDRLKVLGLSREYSELVNRKHYIEHSGVLGSELNRGDVGYFHEIESISIQIRELKDIARSTLSVKPNHNNLSTPIRTDGVADLLVVDARADVYTGIGSSVTFEFERANSFREMAFGELDQIIRSDFVQQGSKKFSWERALDFLLNQSVNVFGNIEASESSSMDAEMGAMVLDYITTRLVELGDYQTLINSREQISIFINQFEFADQAKVRSGLIKNYLIDQYNFIIKMGTTGVDINPHSDLVKEDLVAKSLANAELCDQVWDHWKQLLTINNSSSSKDRDQAIQLILNSPLLDPKTGILRPRSIDPEGYSAYQHATLFLLAARGLNQMMAEAIRPWVTSEPLSRKKMGGVISAMNGTMSRNTGIGDDFAKEEWVATPPSGKTYDSSPSYTAQVIADAINSGVLLSSDEMIKLIERTLPKQVNGWQPPKRVEPSVLNAISSKGSNSYGVPIKEVNRVKNERWTGRLVQALVSMINQFV